MNPFVKFALSVILGPVLIGLIYFVLMNKAATTATRDLTSSMQRQSAAVMARARAQQAATASQAAQAQQTQLKAQADQAQSDLQSARLEQQEVVRKQAAWHAFFQPKKVCDTPPDFDTQVECGNAYMRAKRAFEDRWARGDVQQP